MRFAHPAHQIVLQDYIHAVQDAEARLERLTRQIEELLPSWSMAPVVTALQAMRGVPLVVAATVVAEVGDFRRFANPRQLMAYLGLGPPSRPGDLLRAAILGIVEDCLNRDSGSSNNPRAPGDALGVGHWLQLIMGLIWWHA